MPPKAPKKNNQKNEKSPEEIILQLKEDLKKSHMRIETLERYLVLKSEQAQRAKAEQEEMRERLRQLDEDFEKEKTERFQMASDMIRQYKAMQDDLVSRITDAENQCDQLKDQLSLQQITLEQVKREKDQLIELKDKEIQEQKQKMEDMVVEFGDMMKETLNNMGKTIKESAKEEDKISAALVNDNKLKEIIGQNVDISGDQ